MFRLKINPLSVNNAYTGKRHKTASYKSWKKHLLLILPKLEVPEGDYNLMLIMNIGVVGRFDWDNAIKAFQDVLQEKYGFDDSRVVVGCVHKKVVEDGDQFIDFWLIEKNKEALTAWANTIEW